MKTKFTRLMVLADKINLSIKLLSVLICSILSCFFHNSYAQQDGNIKPVKAVSSQNFNLPQFHRPWFTTGNSGTDTSVNFLGTKDAQPLIFKVNNQRAGYLEYNDFSQITAFGYQSLISNVPSDSDGNTGGIGNSGFGYLALTSNRSGELNTALGQLTLTNNTTGDVNTAVGAYSLISNTEGGFNTAIGSFALNSNTAGGYNTATGDYALNSNTTGFGNIATGTPFTLVSNTEGSENTGTGAFTLTANTTGNANVAYGNFSLATNVTGNNNTALGYAADVAADNLNNATAIGNGALVDASNKVRIGNTDVTSIGGEVGWTIYSDERIKDNIKENVPGLEFIKALRPITYHLNIAKENLLLGVKDIDSKNFSLPELKGIKNGKDFKMPAMKNISDYTKNIKTADKHEIEKVQFTGFVAQDVEKAAKDIGYDFSGIDKSGKIMGLRYSDFVVPLVKSVQELSKQNEDLQKQINELKVMMNVQQLTASNNLQTEKLSSASLEQNTPNPFRNATTINYNLPQKFSHAQIIITDKNGKSLKKINISGSGKGTVNVDAATLSAGAYNYSLYADGKLISSKQMVLTK